MSPLTVGVIKEAAPGERRVALIPDSVAKLSAAGLHVLVEHRAGAGAWFADEAYAAAGAESVSAAEVYERADVVVALARPRIELLHSGQVAVGMLAPQADPGYVRDLAAAGVTAVSLDALPRTLSAAQAMDALTSQANVAGYKAALVAADTYERFFPLLVTAAGTARPARVLVLGAGVAGLQAIGTARRLGAIVSAYDVRPAAREDIASVGAAFLELDLVADAAGEGGYARELTADRQRAEQDRLAGRIAEHDVVITTARVPGRPPPVLVTETALKRMRPGSVVVDLAAGDLGGNVEGSRPGETVVTGGGVTVIGADNLPATMPAAASAAYSHNICALLLHLTRDGELALDLDDPVQAAVVTLPEAPDGRGGTS
ncbi:NAD(P) transhydrogenase subunit alpha [Actinomadura monticuli]|uniref:proton-translocating NAD(P)(+) transhydrogenase n=1 Tax=Actinomadura monticuli TaxID=3097367 RepID=A0ABV4QHK8_9ACTN